MLFIFIPIYVYLCIYTPSYQHFKAFPVSKFNSDTSFLYQLFKEKLNFIVKKPCKVVCLLMMSLFFILLWAKVIHLSMFYDCHYYLYLFICNYLSIYTPSYQHFKAFPLSKFNSETTFLYQLFKEDSNFRVKKPCKVIYLSAYDVFLKPCKIIYLSIFFTIHLYFMNTRELHLLPCT